MRQTESNFQKDNYRIRIKRNAISKFWQIHLYMILFTAGYYAALVWGAFQISFGVMTFGTLTAFFADYSADPGAVS